MCRASAVEVKLSTLVLHMLVFLGCGAALYKNISKDESFLAFLPHLQFPTEISKGKISYFCSEEFNSENSKCCHSSLPCVNLENAINDPTTQNPNSSHFQVQIKEVTSSDIKPLSPKSQSDLSVNLDEIAQESESSEKSSLDAKKYREMRRKNNIASQRSRKIRKQKESELSEQLKKLEKENAELLLLHNKLEKERDTLQKYFLEVIAKK
ncbi:hypothetical protein TNIN_130031 [Trichonephila inaurata madagascariensis]|uniref:BZIP domain-containing protein n=1 Tax=Trichonephila inaurata madagascariensis TaxID=2747483 RepID=A0A8X6XCR9_9ARAC|nr:hypothetical protein TNIN_130031 [Trichonephila inaurata madagascariensis]